MKLGRMVSLIYPFLIDRINGCPIHPQMMALISPGSRNQGMTPFLGILYSPCLLELSLPAPNKQRSHKFLVERTGKGTWSTITSSS